jgi:hypothetical protein
MLSSIHPLGERGRHNRWGLTVAAHLVGSWAGGVAAFTLAALAGLALPDDAVWIAALVAAAAAAVEVRGRRIPGPRRQVNEDWLNRYRGWVYGAGFGFQLGAGLMTIVTTTAVYVALALTALSHDVAAGAVVGSVYGIVRSLPLLAAGRVRTGAQLASLHRRLRSLARPVQLGTTTGLVVLAAVLTAGAL